MTEQEWLSYAKRNRLKLESLIRDWHPRVRRSNKELVITAPNAEHSRKVVANSIAHKSGRLPPTREFNEALNEGNWHRVWVVLNEAWFGVPESRMAWTLLGFEEAVTLLEDPPMGENDNG